MPQEQDLKIRVDELEEKLAKLTKSVRYGEMPTLVRFDKDVALSPGNRFRLEPLDNIVTAVSSPTSRMGQMVGGANISGTTLIANVPAHTLGAVGVWWPVSNSNTPFLITLAGSSNNQAIKLSSGVNANYILLNNTSGGSVDLTGLVAPDSGSELVLLNISAQNVVIKNNSGSSSAANRIYTISAADVTLAQHASIRLRYRTSVGSYITETRTGWQQTL